MPSILMAEPLRSVPELQGIDARGAVRIGSMTTITDLIDNEMLRSRYPVLVQAARRLGSAQIRNVATLGGNNVLTFDGGDWLGGSPVLAYADDDFTYVVVWRPHTTMAAGAAEPTTAA